MFRKYAIAEHEQKRKIMITFEEIESRIINGKEWGEYETTFGRVMVHREQDKAGCYVVVCFLPFER